MSKGLKRKGLVVRIFLNHSRLLKACYRGLRSDDIAFVECTVDEFRRLAIKNRVSEGAWQDISQGIAEKRFIFRRPIDSLPKINDFLRWIRTNGWPELWWGITRKRYCRRRAQRKMKRSGQFDSDRIIL